MGRFDTNPLLSSCLDLVMGTSLTIYIDERQIQDCVHSHRGAKLLDLCDVINQYPNQKLNTVIKISGFNDHRSRIETFRKHWKLLIQLIFVKFSLNNLVVPQLIPTSCNRLINKKISALNYALNNYTDSCALKLFIVSLSFRIVLEPNLFCKDPVHFSFHGNHIFFFILFNIIQ